jgi:hypothetical protein
MEMAHDLGDHDVGRVHMPDPLHTHKPPTLTDSRLRSIRV